MRPTPTLDFIVIGAQKAGTTSLWRYLEDNPALRMPPSKEAPFFSESGYEELWRPYMRALFKRAPRHAKRGTITPPYMVGTPGAAIPAIADRIRDRVPGVKLVALLRDPVARAHSAYRMLVGRGEEERSFPEAVDELLAPDALERSRQEPVEKDTYVVAGEYGRILGIYLERFARDQLHVEMTAELERAPEDVVRRVCEFLGVEPHTPAALGTRFHESGRPRVSAEAEADLKSYLERHVWPRLRHAEQHRVDFERWFAMWNVEADGIKEQVDARTEQRLREHYAGDARTLHAVAGVRAPWA